MNGRTRVSRHLRGRQESVWQNASLAVLPVRLVEVHFEKSTKSKSLNAAMAAIGNDYDIALVLDADNVIPYDYLSDINDLFANPEVEICRPTGVPRT